MAKKYSPKMFQDQRTIYWICDKLDCQHDNYRVIPQGTTVFQDRCDSCRSIIHEPIVIDFDPNGK